MGSKKQKAPFGTWKSPLTAELISRQGSHITGVFVDQVKGSIYELEARSTEAGRCVLVDEKGNDIVDRETNVRTRVHEYGGGAVTVHNGVVYYSNMKDGRLYWIKEGKSEPITPESTVLRYADFHPHPIHAHLLVSVVEDHTNPDMLSVTNSLYIINTSSKSISKLVSGADFYVSPSFSPDGTKLVWQQWNHPDMPWSGAEIHLANVVIDDKSFSVRVENDIRIAGEALKTSATYPSFISPTLVLFINDVSGFQNPWVYDIPTGAAKPILPVPVNEDFALPGWQMGDIPYAIVSSSGEYGVFAAWREGRRILYLLNTRTGQIQELTSDNPYVTLESLQPYNISSDSPGVVFIGSTVSVQDVPVKCTFTSFDPPIYTFSTLHPTPEPLFPNAMDYISSPRPLTLTSPQGGPLHVIYYAPHHPEYDSNGSGEEKPPCIVHVHGGPTSMVTQGLQWTRCFYTTRGWGWLDVNYGGSSCYGRKYIERLDSTWGIVDVQDVLCSAKTLSSSPYSLVDPKRTVIRGGSSGGFTVLACLAVGPQREPSWDFDFAAGTSMYGICDLKMIALDTHKFEARYSNRLVGGGLDECPEVYEERSPINKVKNIKSPLLLLQGIEDPVVPRAQSELIYDTLKKQGGVVEIKLYEGEGHGFRRQENICDSIDRELAFYEKVFGLKG